MTPILVSIICLSLSKLTAADENTISEAVKGFLGSVKDYVGKISEYVGDKNGCVYECAKGYNPVPNTKHKKTSNGCGSFSIQLDAHIKIQELTECCNEHDICYDTCSKPKKKCDSEFKKCLVQLCKSLKNTIQNACEKTADAFYAATVALGCKPYKDSQAKACICKKIRNEL